MLFFRWSLSLKYRLLGCSGLKVSELSLGPWLTISKHLSVKKSLEIIKHAVSNGINFFDNAERYAEGMAESVLGQVFKHFLREDLVIATKIYWGGEGVNCTGLSRKHLVEGTKNSLRRLQLDYVDVLFCHRPDSNTPIEEIVITMNNLISSGYTFYWGTSEWPVTAIEEAHQAAERLRCIPPVVEQTEYNLFKYYRVHNDCFHLNKCYGTGVMAYAPLASGILTGKYAKGFAQDFRLTKEKRLCTPDLKKRLQVVDQFNEIALSFDIKPAQLAIAWCLQKSYVCSVLIGASTVAQLSENLKSVELQSKLDDTLMHKISNLYDEQLGNKVAQ